MCAMQLSAQPWMPQKTNGPVKFTDAVANYHQMFGENKHTPMQYKIGKDGRRKPIESNAYHFGRWQWYWSRHLDENGNMVQPSVTYNNWMNYLEKKGLKNAAKTTASSANWIFQGPDSSASGYSGIGRINCVGLHPTDAGIIYAGTAGGGLWRTTDTGRTWAPLYSNLTTLAVSDIAINPLNPNTIYVCTGDANGYGSYSMGVIKSVDGGANWNVVWTPTWYDWPRSIVINPNDTSCLLLGASNGMFMSRNAAATWTLTDSANYKQLMYKPGDTTTVYASRYATWPENSSQIMRSVNGGRSWSQVTSLTDAQRIALAVCPAAPAVVKALVSDNNTSGLHSILSSNNSGASFSTIFSNDTSCSNNLLGYSLTLPTTQCGGQGWYDLCIAIDPLDANKVIIGGINNYYSTDGGYNWGITTTWWSGITGVQTVHADKHSLNYSPIDHSLYQGCDGGIYRNPNMGIADWDDISNGMGITQFYRNAVASGVNFCLGGAQDNGTKMLDAGTYSDLTGGDGMLCRIDYDYPSMIWYTSYQNGGLNRTNDGGFSYEYIRNNIPDTIDGAWITPYLIHPSRSNSLLAGLDILFASDDYGDSWSAISPQFDSDELIIDITMSKASDSVIYVLVSDNSVRYTTNYGASWITLPDVGSANTISRIVADPVEKQVVWATFGGFSSRKVARYDHNTRTWASFDGTLPNVPVNVIVIDTFSKTKYIGTDVAVFYRDTTMSDWALYNSNLPSVEVADLNINYGTGELWAATYGRGMWKSVKREEPTRVSEVPYRAGVITVFPNPNTGTFSIQTTNSLLISHKVAVRLLDITGKQVWATSGAFDGSGLLKIATDGIAPGMYICETTTDNMAARCRVTVN